MKIAILTLTNQRDDLIDGILANCLRKLGHEVNVRNYIYAGREAVCYEKPEVVIHPMVGGRYKLDFVKKCKEWGCEVIVRRGEAGVTSKVFNSENMSEDQRDLILGYWNYSPYVDMELVWGADFAHLLALEGHLKDRRKIKWCGAFAFDPYFAPGFERDRNHKKTILFATGFSTCDCRSDYCECGLPEESGYHERIYARHRAARDKWIASIKKLHQRYGNSWLFELKVRPGEMEEEYVTELSDIVKIHPQRSSSSEVLRKVDMLIHSGSTMAIEAHLMGIPSFNYINVNPDPFIAGVSRNVETYNELERLVGQTDTDRSNINYAVLRQLEDLLYGAIDGKACVRAADYIDQHLKGLKIKTDIPNTWPKTTEYLEDNVHLEKQKSDARWVCPCCRNVYYAAPNGVTRCPFCSMQIHMTSKAPVGQGVLK